MPKRISITLLFAVAIATVALFAVTEVGAQYSGTFDPWTTFTYSGTDFKGDPFSCTVETASTFPDIINCPTDPAKKCSKYCWTITDCSPSHIVFLIGQDFEAKFEQATVNSSPASWVPLCDGTVDPSIDMVFGENLIYNCNAKIDGDFSGTPPNTACAIFEGELGTRPTDLLIKGGQFRAYGPINSVGPPCEPVVLGVSSSTECNILATLPAGTVYIDVVRGPDGCSVDEDASTFYVNSKCNPNADECGPTTLAAGCKYVGPPPDCADYPDCGEVGEPECPSFCLDKPEEGFQICSGRLAPGCPECVNVLSGSPTCVKYTTSSGTRIKSCFRPDGTTCSWKKCCKSPTDPTANCGW